MLAVALFGVYAVFSLLYGVLTFSDRPEEGLALKQVGVTLQLGQATAFTSSSQQPCCLTARPLVTPLQDVDRARKDLIARGVLEPG